MARMSAIFLFCVTSLLSTTESTSDNCRGTHCFPAQDWSRLCAGEHCPGRTEAAASRRQFHQPAQARQAQVYPSYQQDSHLAQSAPLVPYTIIQPQRGGTAQVAGTDGTMRTNPRTITAEVFHPGCAGGTCQSGVTSRTVTNDGATRECKGLECKLPQRMRQKPRACVGDNCGASGGEDGRGNPSPVHVTDRAAQFLGEFSDFGSERGGASLGIQLSCDLKPGQYQMEKVIPGHLCRSKRD